MLGHNSTGNFCRSLCAAGSRRGRLSQAASGKGQQGAENTIPVYSTCSEEVRDTQLLSFIAARQHLGMPLSLHKASSHPSATRSRSQMTICNGVVGRSRTLIQRANVTCVATAL